MPFLRTLSKTFADIALNDRQQRKCFYILFIIAICGYLSILTSHYQHQDDYTRYITNATCGVNGRLLTFLLEAFINPTGYAMDISPFTQIISCGLLAYAAVICAKIVNSVSVSSILCFAPIVINPLLAESMLFKFDNIFFMVALVLTVIAAHISANNSSLTHCIIQTTLLFCSLETYQAAFNAYGIIFTYLFIKDIQAGHAILETIKKMKYWIYSAISAALLYLPSIYKVNYCSWNGSMFIKLQDIHLILDNIALYYSELFYDWNQNLIGIVAFLLLLIFCFTILKDNGTSLKTTTVLLILLFIFFTMPYGVNAFLYYSQQMTFVPSRIIYSAGIMMSFAMFESYRSLQNYALAYKALTVTMSLFTFWNITFVNSLGNLHNAQEQLFHQVIASVSENIAQYNKEKNNSASYFLYFKDSLITLALDNFAKSAPIAKKILISPWKGHYFACSLLNNLAKHSSTAPISTERQGYVNYIDTPFSYIVDLDKLDKDLSNAKLIKTHSAYDLFVSKLYGKLCYSVVFKSKTNNSKFCHVFMVQEK